VTAGTGDMWLFAYGSLIWNPLFPVAEERIARVHGLHRSFCIWTRVGRGTPERPGLVLGLDSGGACKGVALRLEAAIARAELALVWRREMLTGAYRPVWVKARTASGDIDAIAFVANRASASYAGRRTEAEVCATITGARGLIGTCGDYLRQTHEGLQSRGIRDRTLERLLLRTGEGACS
jgi:cation transport protein ChaC